MIDTTRVRGEKEAVGSTRRNCRNREIGGHDSENFSVLGFSLPSVSLYGYPADADVAVAGVTVADRRRSRDPSRRTGNGTDSVYDTDCACGTDGGLRRNTATSRDKDALHCQDRKFPANSLLRILR